VAAGAFNFYPTPYTAMTAYVSARRNLKPAAMTLDTVMTYPPGYERMLVDQLALDICPSFGVQPSQALVMSARESKSILKTANHVPLLMNVGRYVRPNIYNGP
jgi:hypothetical protein